MFHPFYSNLCCFIFGYISESMDMNWFPFLDLCNIKDKSMFIPMACKINKKDSLEIFYPLRLDASSILNLESTDGVEMDTHSMFCSFLWLHDKIFSSCITYICI